MFSIELTDEQAAVLQKYLQRALSELSHEIADTDSYDFRQSLKGERELLQDIAGQLSGHDADESTEGDG